MPSERGEMSEAAEYLRELGIVSLAERRADLERILNEAQQLEAKEKLNLLAEKVKAVPAFQRLIGVAQLGGKFNRELPPGPDRASVVGPAENRGNARDILKGVKVLTPAVHSRYDHCELNGELAAVAGLKMGMSARDIKVVMLGGLLHDLGHSAFSHAGDDFLSGRNRPSHEERTCKKIRRDPALQKIFDEEGVSAEEVIEVVEEKGTRGSLQKVLDAVSYLVLDCGPMLSSGRAERDASFLDILKNSGASLLDDIDTIVEAEGEQLVVVKTPALWQKLVELRARMMQNLYYHPFHRMVDGAKGQLLRLAVGRGFLTEGEIEDGTDSGVMLKIQSLVQRDAGAARMSGRREARAHLAEYKNLFCLANGDYDPRAWEMRTFKSREEAQGFLNGVMLPSGLLSQSFIVGPSADYAEKSLVLAVKNGSRHERRRFKAEATKRTEMDDSYLVFLPKK